MTRQEIRAALKGVRADNVRLTAERDRLRKALEWYADEYNYKLLGDYCPFSGADWTFRHIINDEGAKARAALKPAGGEPHV